MQLGAEVRRIRIHYDEGFLLSARPSYRREDGSYPWSTKYTLP